MQMSRIKMLKRDLRKANARSRISPSYLSVYSRGRKAKSSAYRSEEEGEDGEEDGHSSEGEGASSSDDEEENWVQCDQCTKWRRLPKSVDASLLPEEWQCSLNAWDSARDKCAVAQELSPDDDSLVNDGGGHLDDEALTSESELAKAAVQAHCQALVEQIWSKGAVRGKEDVWLRGLFGVLHHPDAKVRCLAPWSPCGTAFGIHRDAVKLVGGGRVFPETRLLTFRRKLAEFGVEELYDPEFPLDSQEIQDISCYVRSPWLTKSLSLEEFCAMGARAKFLRHNKS
mmetsp:Transcript_83878/g.167974  ORF Transcript_83878/g.167974 Transcript_83878/m.167974 type:complete len:285 (-) Transcript_83878:8-862(-)